MSIVASLCLCLFKGFEVSQLIHNEGADQVIHSRSTKQVIYNVLFINMDHGRLYAIFQNWQNVHKLSEVVLIGHKWYKMTNNYLSLLITFEDLNQAVCYNECWHQKNT